MQDKICFNCNADLTCGSQQGNCWCMAYTQVVITEGQECLCEICLQKNIESAMASSKEMPPEQEADYYIENGFYVFTRSYHLKRGSCCKNSCRHCPYGYKKS